MKMKKDQGTPSTLKKALENGLDDFNTGDYQSHEELVELLRQHVEEYMRNKLGHITMASDEPEVLKGVEKIVNSLK